jgi:hypothetical protein
MDTEQDPHNFEKLISEATRLEGEIDAILPRLASARRNYMRSRNETDRTELDRVQKIASDLSDRHNALYEGLKRASGLSAEQLAEIDKPHLPGDGKDRLLREDLQAQSVGITGFVDTHVGEAVEALTAIIPSGWLAQQPDIQHRIDSLISGKECLSIVKGLRPESEFSALHRLRQMVRTAEDYRTECPTYDHFAGATLVPQLVQLGSRLKYLDDVGGDVDARLRRLWEGMGDSTDATVFELLVAAGCVKCGRNVEFMPETHEKSPDIRCHDPFPMVIECKRKRALKNYELAEEAAMRSLFLELETQASRKGLFGRFDLRLNIEASKAPKAEIITCMVSQRLAPHPERQVAYPWGSVAYYQLPRRIAMPTTRLYSPNMLMAAFGWNSDLPEWDGIVCRVVGAGQAWVDEIRNPFALVWSNSSSTALKKRAWSPLDLFGDAINQIPPGEYGIIYLAYHEGTRAEIADRRIKTFFDRMPEWDQPASICVPISFLVRLYPRPLDHGNPDLIESTVRLCSALYGEPSLFDDFPSSIFTESPSREA